MATSRKLAVCDPAAFDPFRRLVEGPLTGPDDLEAAERFIRTVVLHDDLAMGSEELPYRAEDYEDQRQAIRERASAAAAAGKPFAPGNIAGLVIMFTSRAIQVEKLGYGLFCGDLIDQAVSTTELSPSQLEIVSRYSNAEEGNPFYASHLKYLERLFGVVRDGGSVLCEFPFPRAALDRATQFPTAIFESLDRDWKSYAQELQTGTPGLTIPPVLSIILNNCARRDAIPAAVIDLRNDWAAARHKVWRLVEDHRSARTLGELRTIEREFAEASKSFTPTVENLGTSPRRMLWDIFAAAGSGAVTATLAGGNPKVGAIVGSLAGTLNRAIPQIKSTGDARKLFRLGAFDLAAHVRHATMSVTPAPDQLLQFLSNSEKRALGYTSPN
jgi:hypothetical protein